MFKISASSASLNQRGSSLLGVLIASAVLLTTLLALASSFFYVQALDSTIERKENVQDYIRSHLQVLKGLVSSKNGVVAFLRSVEADPSQFNPTITYDLNNPTNFIAQFGFANSTTQNIRNVPYRVKFTCVEYKFNAARVAVPITLGTDTLRDVSYLQFTATLTPLSNAASSLEGPKARYGEVFLAK